MREIKMRDGGRIPKVRNPAGKMPRELAKAAALEAKEKSHRIASGTRNDEGQQYATEFASGKIETAEEWAAGKVVRSSTFSARNIAKKSYGKIRERKMGEGIGENLEKTGMDCSLEEEPALPEQTSLPETMKPSTESVKGNPAKGRLAGGQKIKAKTEAGGSLRSSSSRSVKTAPRIANMKFSGNSLEKIQTGRKVAQNWQRLHGETAARQMALNAAKAERAGAERGAYSGRKAVQTVRELAAAVRKAVSAVKYLQALMVSGVGIVLFFMITIGVVGGILYDNSSQSTEPFSAEVLSYTPVIQRYAQEYGIPEYVPIIQAIMMQESGGQGTDPMQASECPYNTRFPHSPGGIAEPEYSIQVGVQNYAECIRQAGCTSPQDMDRLKLSLQGYNYGNGYITWAIQNYGGYSEANALRFSREQAAAHGWSGYGDPEYVPHVLRYYSGGNLFAGLFGSNQMVSVALAELGNEGGQKFWSWYGFNSREEWCACFVSWCADQCGLIANGTVPRFSLCSDGMRWFQGNGKWRGNHCQPSAGTIIFFDWNGDGNPDHVGIVEKCENGRVYTVEGNSGDVVQKGEYAVESGVILGYGVIVD